MGQMASAQLVKPSTPVVISFYGKKKITLNADLVVRLFPALAETVKTLTTSTDKDGGVRSYFDICTRYPTLTVEQALKLISYACGGVYDPTARLLYKRHNIAVPEMGEIELPPVSLFTKGAGSTGAMTCLMIKGTQDTHWVDGCKSFKTFGGAFPGIPDTFYAVCTQTLDMDEAKKEFTIPRLGDLAHTFVLKVELEGPADLDSLFETMELSVGGYMFVAIDLHLNNVLARAQGLWPSKTNDAKRIKGQKWVATIPFMIRETSAYTKVVSPTIALMYHETRVALKGMSKTPAKYALDVDYVYLDTESRRWMANDGRSAKQPAKAPDIASPCACAQAGAPMSGAAIMASAAAQAVAAKAAAQAAQVAAPKDQWACKPPECWDAAPAPAPEPMPQTKIATPQGAQGVPAAVGAQAAPSAQPGEDIILEACEVQGRGGYVAPCATRDAHAAGASRGAYSAFKEKGDMMDPPRPVELINARDHYVNPAAFSADHTMIFTQYSTVREYLPQEGSRRRHINLGDMSHPTSGFIITATPDDPDAKQCGVNLAPILSASIMFNGNTGLSYDFSDLTEWNWMKCNTKAPSDYCTLLMPMSREMFWADQRDDVFVCPCTVNLSRLDSLVLTLDLNEEAMLCGWNISITSVSTNISRTSTGMMAARYGK